MREEPSVETAIKGMVRDLEEVKTAQALTGDGWIFYRAVTGNYPDISIPVGDLTRHRYLITFTPETNDPYAARLIYEWFSDAGAQSTYIYRVEGTENQWYFVVNHPSNNTTLAFVLQCTHAGTLTVEAI